MRHLLTPPLLEKIFPWKKKADQPTRLSSFRAILVSRRIAEYRGALPRTGSAQVEHWLFSERLTPSIARAMLDQGFKGAGAGIPTHVVYCLHFLLRDKGTPRCLFCCYLDLAEIKSPELQDWVTYKITQALSRSLLDCHERSFLIRCKGREFDWCLSNIELDDYWLAECAKFYRFYLRRVRSLQVGEKPKG